MPFENLQSKSEKSGRVHAIHLSKQDRDFTPFDCMGEKDGHQMQGDEKVKRICSGKNTEN